MRDRLREIANTARHIRDLCVISEPGMKDDASYPELAQEITFAALQIQSMAGRLVIKPPPVAASDPTVIAAHNTAQAWIAAHPDVPVVDAIDPKAAE